MYVVSIVARGLRGGHPKNLDSEGQLLLPVCERNSDKAHYSGFCTISPAKGTCGLFDFQNLICDAAAPIYFRTEDGHKV